MKARWFTLLGYNKQKPNELVESLLELANQDIQTSEETNYGTKTKYVIVGEIKGPNGRAAKIISIWMIPTSDSVPKLVTAYPSK